MNGPRILVGFGMLTVVLSQAFPVRLLAQSNTCPNTQEAQQNAAPQMRVVVDAVEFQGEGPLSDAERAELASEIQKTEFVAQSSTDEDWATEAIQGGGDFRGVSRPGLKAQVYEADLFFSDGLKPRTSQRT